MANGPRVGANAIVVEDDRLLAVAFDDDTGHHYNLPGGGVEPGESIADALVREVREETTVTVAVGELAFVHEYEPGRAAGRYGTVHKLTLFFRCERREGSPAMPPAPDPHQVGVEWLPLARLDEVALLPPVNWQDRLTGSACFLETDG